MKFEAFKSEVSDLFPAGSWRFFEAPEHVGMHGAEHESGLCVLRGTDDFGVKWSVAPLEISCDALSVAVRYAWQLGGWRLRRRIKAAMGVTLPPFWKCGTCGGGRAIGRTMNECTACASTGYVVVVQEVCRG